MKRLLRVSVLTFVLAALSPGLAMATVSPLGTPTITGTAQVGGTLTCNDPGWSSNDGGFPQPTDFTWYYSTDTTTPIFDSGSGLGDTYSPAPADVGHKLVCTETEQDSSPATAPALHPATARRRVR